MTILKTWFILCGAMLALGATPNVDYSYLMTHSDALEQAVKECEQDLAGPNCLVVRQAVTDFVKLVAERRDNAQTFGKQILANQTQLVELNTQFEALKPDSADYTKAKEAYLAQLQKVNVLLAVVSATSMN